MNQSGRIGIVNNKYDLVNSMAKQMETNVYFSLLRKRRRMQAVSQRLGGPPAGRGSSLRAGHRAFPGSSPRPALRPFEAFAIDHHRPEAEVFPFCPSSASSRRTAKVPGCQHAGRSRRSRGRYSGRAFNRRCVRRIRVPGRLLFMRAACSASCFRASDLTGLWCR